MINESEIKDSAVSFFGIFKEVKKERWGKFMGVCEPEDSVDCYPVLAWLCPGPPRGVGRPKELLLPRWSLLSSLHKIRIFSFTGPKPCMWKR